MDLYYKMKRLYTFIVRFFYYGYHGAKYTADWDASCLHELIYAHMKRVNKFMHDDDLTHLMWNSNRDNKGMRLLREFTELSKRLKYDTMVGDNLSKLFKEHPSRILMNEPRPKEILKMFKIARKKDEMVRKGLEDRYWYLLRYKTPEFWD